MKRHVLWLAAFLTLRCATIRLDPSPTHPVRACAITCPGSKVTFRKQHLCQAGKRHFEEVQLIGENVIRAGDGSIESAHWIACTGQWKPSGACSETTDYEKDDVVLQDCAAYIRSIVLAREPSERGLHPGDRDYGRKD